MLEQLTTSPESLTELSKGEFLVQWTVNVRHIKNVKLITNTLENCYHSVYSLVAHEDKYSDASQKMLLEKVSIIS